MTLILCILLLRRRNWKIVSDLEWTHSGSDCYQKFVLVVSMWTQFESFSAKHVVLNRKKMTWESLDSSRKSSDVQRCYVYVAWRIAAMLLPHTKIYSVAKASKNVCKNRPGQISGKSLPRLGQKLKITSTNKGFRTSNYAVPTYEQNEKNSCSFILIEMGGAMDITLEHSNCKTNNFILKWLVYNRLYTFFFVFL